MKTHWLSGCRSEVVMLDTLELVMQEGNTKILQVPFGIPKYE